MARRKQCHMKQATREQPPLDLPEVVAIPNIGYGVRSASVPGALRVVSGNTCTCPAGDAKTCRHRRAVDEFCKDRAKEYARPTVPGPAEWFVD